MLTLITFFNPMTLEKLSWITAFAAGLTCFLTGIIYLINKKGRRDTHYAWASFWEFIACWILYIPREVFNDVPHSSALLKWVEGVFTALLKSFNIYAGNSYERAAFAGHETFSSIYGILRVSANIAMTLFVGGFILSFLNGPLQRFKLFCFRDHYLYIFSSCNEKTLTIARSIPRERMAHHAQIVFACGDDKVDAGYREEIDALGGLYVASGIAAIAVKYANAISGMEFFLFEENEDTNLIKLHALCQALHPLKKNREMKIYVELSKSPWGLYDNYVEKQDLKDRNIVVNFVRIEETFIYSDLLKHSIFEKAAAAGDVKEIRALIVGEMNPRNTEMFKALLHLSQMPGYFLDLTVIESEHSRSKLRQLMPEVGDDGKGVGDAIYHINYLEGIPYESDALENAVKTTCPNFTFAFVNAGADLLNIHLAIQLSAIAQRGGHSPEDFSLQVSLASKSIYDSWNSDLCGNLVPVGDYEDIYDYQFVTYSDIERASERIHLARHSTTPWLSYLNNEYNRHSVYARTLSYKYKIQLLGDRYSLAGSPVELEWYTLADLENIWSSMSEEEKLWKVYEHMRWDMYTRTLGYRFGSSDYLNKLVNENTRLLYEIREINLQLAQIGLDDDNHAALEKRRDELNAEKRALLRKIKQVRDAQKIHHTLVPFDELPLEEKIKDNLELTEEVVKVLKEI